MTSGVTYLMKIETETKSVGKRIGEENKKENSRKGTVEYNIKKYLQEDKKRRRVESSIERTDVFCPYNEKL